MSKKEFPPGTKVRLSTDYPNEEPREVAGSKTICGFDYLVFSDGYMAFLDRVIEN